MSTARRSASERVVEVLNRQRRRSVDGGRVARVARAALDRAGRPEATVTVTLVGDPRMRQLNRDYRGIDAPTDVLSFAYGEAEDGGAEPGHLGDMVISVETAERYAGRLGHTFEREIDHLVIHGALHLAGYDHETDEGQMERLERRLRRELLG
ncbi:MAG TPA: rRNA maturation RNase YbeY [Blastocatellia bacterium]|jgi:probable rRNA maturation factor|nr:rRNA maturation RNase YbeY [Blastocatellia bacterium]